MMEILLGCKEWWNKVKNNNCWSGAISGTDWDDLCIDERDWLNSIFIVAGEELNDGG